MERQGKPAATSLRSGSLWLSPMHWCWFISRECCVWHCGSNPQLIGTDPPGLSAVQLNHRPHRDEVNSMLNILLDSNALIVAYPKLGGTRHPNRRLT